MPSVLDNLATSSESTLKQVIHDNIKGLALVCEVLPTHRHRASLQTSKDQVMLEATGDSLVEALRGLCMAMLTRDQPWDPFTLRPSASPLQRQRETTPDLEDIDPDQIQSVYANHRRSNT